MGASFAPAGGGGFAMVVTRDAECAHKLQNGLAARYKESEPVDPWTWLRAARSRLVISGSKDQCSASVEMSFLPSALKQDEPSERAIWFRGACAV